MGKLIILIWKIVCAFLFYVFYSACILISKWKLSEIILVIYTTSNGVKQGGVLSPLLFNV